MNVEMCDAWCCTSGGGGEWVYMKIRQIWIEVKANRL